MPILYTPIQEINDIYVKHPYKIVSLSATFGPRFIVLDRSNDYNNGLGLSVRSMVYLIISN